MSKSKTVSRRNMTQTDMQGRVIRKPRDNSDDDSVNFKWWKLPEGKRAPAIAATLKFIQTHQGGRMEQLIRSTRLYGNTSTYNIFGSALSKSMGGQVNSASERISYNICQSVGDTLIAKMAKNKVVPTYITNGGVWTEQKKAKQLTKFTQGLFYQEKIHGKSIEAFGDGYVWGDGFVYVFRKDDKVCVERTLPHELWTDEVEGAVGEPRQLHRVKLMDRDIALELFPELEEQIETVSKSNYQEVGGQGSAADLITVVESWHLRSGKEAKDGLHVISIGDGDWSEEYKRDYFPFPHFRYARRKIGWYAQGGCERLQNIQSEVNRNMILKQRSLWMQGSFKVLLENSSKVVSQHINNDVGTLIRYTTTPPQYVTPPATNPELQQWIDNLIEKGYRQEGVSQLAAAGEKPIGVDSGKAMRTLTDIENDRFLYVGQEMEAFQLEIARQAISVIKEICEDDEIKSYKVTFPNTRFLETVDWKDIDLDEECYVLKAYPTSELSDDLTGRLSEVQEMMQAGLISPRTGKRLMDMPDIEMNENLSNAAEDRLHQMFEDMLDDGKYTAPEAPWHDLQLAKQLVVEYYNYAEYMGAPDNRLALLNKFNAQLSDAMGLLTPTAPLQGGTQVGPPTAMPTATPQSNLIPNTVQAGAA